MGLFGKNKKLSKQEEKKSGITIEQETNKENKLKDNNSAGNIGDTPKWVSVVMGMIAVVFISLYCLLLYYQYYIFQNDISLVDNTGVLTSFFIALHNNGNSFEVIANIIFLIIINIILLLILLIIAFVVFVVCIQIIKSGHRMFNDLIKSINNPNGTDYSSTVFYSFIVFVICFFAYKLYPFELNDFAKVLSDGVIIIYPVMAAIFIPIITTVIDALNSTSISGFLNKDSTKKIKEKFGELALGTLEAILNYITFVTKDFLRSIQELSINEFIEPDNVGGENDNDNNTEDSNSANYNKCNDSDDYSDETNQ